jgi:hypothetical protein
MLNRRLYLQTWLISIVALLVAFLTLQPPPEDLTTDVVTAFNATDALAVSNEFGTVAPERTPGTPAAAAAADWVRRQFATLPGQRVATQSFVARVDGATIPMTNVLFTLPSAAATHSQRNILIVAPRDTPRGVRAGTSGTGILVEMARTAAKSSYRHPLIFLSADGSTVGNAGLRWYLHNVDRSLIAAVVVLDAPGEGDGGPLHIWSGGAGRQALALRLLAAQAVRRAGTEAEGVPSMRRQLLDLAVPETRGDQRAAIDAGIPAVTLSGRDESRLSGSSSPTRDRIDGAGGAALGLVALLDAQERANAPDASLAYAGRILRPSVARLALLLLALPILVMALDAAARVRRARVRLSAGLKAVSWRFVAPLTVLFIAHVLGMLGVLRPPDVGRPPGAADLHTGARVLLAVALLGIVGAAMWMWIRPRVSAIGTNPPAEAAGALVWLAVLTMVAWWLAPFSLVLILPAAHAALAATVVARRWQVAALAAIAIAPLLAVVVVTSAAIDRNPLFTVWYLCQTSVTGARGMLGPVLAVLVGVCVVSLGTLVVFRARKGLVTGRARPRPPRARAAR